MEGPERVYENGYLICNDESIEACGQFTPEVERDILSRQSEFELINQIHDGHIVPINGILMPSFVKTHGHEETCLIGLKKEDILTQWLDDVVNPFSAFINTNIDRLTAQYGESPFSLVFKKCRTEDLAFGITTSVLHLCNWNKYHVDEAVEACKASHCRALIGIGSQDRNFSKDVIDTVPQALARLDDAHRKHNSEKLIRCFAAPDQDFSNSPEMLKALKAWARQHTDGLLHIHSSEEQIATLLFKKRYGMTPIQYFESLGILDGSTFVAHQVQCTEDDYRILRDTKTAVASNPLANTVLQSGVAPYGRFQREGIKYAVSTDGSGSADNQNILAALKLAMAFMRMKGKPISAYEGLKLITTDPADILGVNAGRLEPGRLPDFVILDIRTSYCSYVTKETIAESVVGMVGNEIQYLCCQNRLLVDDYRIHADFDQEKVFAQIEDLTRQFVAYMNTSFDSVISAKRETGVGWEMNITEADIRALVEQDNAAKLLADRE